MLRVSSGRCSAGCSEFTPKLPTPYLPKKSQPKIFSAPRPKDFYRPQHKDFNGGDVGRGVCRHAWG